MKAMLVTGMVVFVAGLAIALGSRLPTEALTVVIGVACGVLASIPTSVLIVAVALRREGPAGKGPAVQQQYPPVVVVNAPPGPSGQPGPWPAPAWAPQMPPPGPRQFRVIGQENDLPPLD